MAPPPSAKSAAAARTAFHLQFITAPTADTAGTAMLLHFNEERYIFGQISEGFQRACIQRGAGLRKIRNLFLTGPTEWRMNGGLIGLILCLADIEVTAEAQHADPPRRQRLHIHGGPKLLHALACARRFVFRTGVPLTVHENRLGRFKWQDAPTFSDDNIRVWSIPIFADTENNVFGDSNTDQEQEVRRKVVSDMFESDWSRHKLFERPFKEVKMPATVWVRHPETNDLQRYHCLNHESAPDISPDQIVLCREPWPAALVSGLPAASNLPSNVSMSYIVKGYPQRGAFDPHKAKSLGVKPGPVYADLANGASVTLDDGTVITSGMVLGATREARGFAFIDLPSPSQLHYFLQMLGSQPPEMLEGVSVAVWMLGSRISSSQAFVELLASLPDMEHVVCDPDTAPNRAAYESVALSNISLAQFAPTHFPAVNLSETSSYRDEDTWNVKLPRSNVSVPKPGAKVTLYPNLNVDLSEAQTPFEPSRSSIEDVCRGWQTLQQAHAQEFRANTDLQEPEIITLGTGSASPSKYRNVSGTLLRMPGDQGNYLFDCGENTLGQLRRIYPANKLKNILQNLKAIWISHMHADHHLGTISVLLERSKAFEGLSTNVDRAIFLVSESTMHAFIEEYSSVEPMLLTETGLVQITSSESTGITLDGQSFSFADSSSALRTVESVRVSHCAGAQAVSFTFKSGFKISYSGDCRPSSHFCRIGIDSDVLIHEATFDNGMEKDAAAKKHSTTAEALGVAMNMRAKNVVLTHFSQRYHKIPNFDNIRLPEQVRFEEGHAAQDEEPVDNGAPPTTANDENSVNCELAPTGQQSTVVAPSTDAPQTNLPPEMHIAVAFDYMRFSISEIPGLKQIYPKIQAMFDAQDQREEEQKEKNKQAMAERERLKQEHTLQKRREREQEQTKKQKRTQNNTPKKKVEPVEGRRMGNGTVDVGKRGENNDAIIPAASVGLQEGEDDAETRQINDTNNNKSTHLNTIEAMSGKNPSNGPNNTIHPSPMPIPSAKESPDPTQHLSRKARNRLNRQRQLEQRKKTQKQVPDNDPRFVGVDADDLESHLIHSQNQNQNQNQDQMQKGTKRSSREIRSQSQTQSQGQNETQNQIQDMEEELLDDRVDGDSEREAKRVKS